MVWKGCLTLQSCWHFQPCPLWSAVPLPGEPYSLQFAHEEPEAQTGTVTAQSFPVLEWLLQGLLDSGSSVPSMSPRQKGFQSGPHCLE